MRAHIIASRAAVDKSSLVGPAFASHEIEIISQRPLVCGRPYFAQ